MNADRSRFRPKECDDSMRKVEFDLHGSGSPNSTSSTAEDNEARQLQKAG
jgi:hypothetical protein